jgi:hypothetical protein
MTNRNPKWAQELKRIVTSPEDVRVSERYSIPDTLAFSIIQRMYNEPTRLWTYDELKNGMKQKVSTFWGFEGRIAGLLENGIIESASDGSIERKFRLTDSFYLFLREPNANFLKISIQIKENEIKLKDLADFYQHVPWLLNNYKELKEVFLGDIRLSREEAEEVIKQLEEEQAFKKGY